MSSQAKWYFEGLPTAECRVGGGAEQAWSGGSCTRSAAPQKKGGDFCSRQEEGGWQERRLAVTRPKREVWGQFLILKNIKKQFKSK